MVAVPLAIDVTSPVEETVATVVSAEVHATVAVPIVCPFWSLTVAESWDVAPNETKLRLVVERVIEVATDVGGVGGVDGPVGVLASSPHPIERDAKRVEKTNSCFFIWTMAI